MLFHLKCSREAELQAEKLPIRLVPSEGLLTETLPNNHATSFQAEGNQVLVRTSLEALLLATNLLFSVVTFVSGQSAGFSPHPSQHDIMWPLDYISEAWLFLRNEETISVNPLDNGDLSFLLLRITRILTSYLLNNHVRAVSTSRASMLLMKQVANKVRSLSDTDQAWQEEISEALLTIMDAASAAEVAAHNASDILLPALLIAFEAVNLDAFVQQRLRVNYNPKCMVKLAKQKQACCTTFIQAFAPHSKMLLTQLAFDPQPNESVLPSRFRNLQLVSGMDHSSNGERATKRRRISAGKPHIQVSSPYKEITSKVFKLLGDQVATDLGGLRDVATLVPTCEANVRLLNLLRGCFARLSEDDRCLALRWFGYVACTGARSLQVYRNNDGNIMNIQCSICDAETPCQEQVALWLDDDSEELFATLSNLIGDLEFQSSTRPRVWAMEASRRLINHTDRATYLELEHSPIAQWCLQSLCSTVRELRIAAG